jgi:predicted anti-sigma-YlaC factor YlaD
MNDFFWSSGHLGWGFFALAVFTGLLLLLGDLYWRLQNIRIGRLLLALSAAWIVGAGLIILGLHIGNPW